MANTKTVKPTHRTGVPTLSISIFYCSRRGWKRETSDIIETHLR
jgi:hypothetical protein